MKKITLIFILLNILISCNFFGPVTSDIQTKNVDYTEKNIIGTWKLDKFSYEYLSKKENLDSIYIVFNTDSTFVLNNSIKLFDRTTDLSKNEKINGKLDNIKINGKWKITNFTHKDLTLKYNNDVLGLNVYKKGDEFQIWYYFNDPDTGQRLRFLKEK